MRVETIGMEENENSALVALVLSSVVALGLPTGFVSVVPGGGLKFEEMMQSSSMRPVKKRWTCCDGLRLVSSSAGLTREPMVLSF